MATNQNETALSYSMPVLATRLGQAANDTHQAITGSYQEQRGTLLGVQADLLKALKLVDGLLAL